MGHHGRGAGTGRHSVLRLPAEHGLRVGTADDFRSMERKTNAVRVHEQSGFMRPISRDVQSQIDRDRNEIAGFEFFRLQCDVAAAPVLTEQIRCKRFSADRNDIMPLVPFTISVGFPLFVDSVAVLELPGKVRRDAVRKPGFRFSFKKRPNRIFKRLCRDFLLRCTARLHVCSFFNSQTEGPLLNGLTILDDRNGGFHVVVHLGTGFSGMTPDNPSEHRELLNHWLSFRFAKKFFRQFRCGNSRQFQSGFLPFGKSVDCMFVRTSRNGLCRADRVHSGAIHT